MSSAALLSQSDNVPSASRVKAPKVLVADDDQGMCEMLEAGLRASGLDVTWRLTADEALGELGRQDYTVMLVDIQMDGKNGLDLCQEALAQRPDMPVIVMTGFGTVDHAVGAIRAGAYDFVSKPISIAALTLTLDRAIQHRTMTDELRRLRQRVETGALPNVIGRSDAVRRMTDLILRVAETDTSVLVTGESGTGKELVAHALHEQSKRKGAFLAVNCAAMPETLLESELFGYVRGAFTDARSDREGLFVAATGGTLFLDEIGEMPLSMQAKLLRALQERKVRPIGASKEVPFNTRIITATNRDLEAEVAAKTFREDLFYRINVVRIDVPPLRHRGSDVLALAQHFLNTAAGRSRRAITGFDKAAADKMMRYEWPGNVRELENCIERAVALARFDTITLEDLPLSVREHRVDDSFDIEDAGTTHAELPTMDVVEERYIRRVLASVHGNKTLAAKVLGFDRRTLYRKLKQAPPGEGLSAAGS